MKKEEIESLQDCLERKKQKKKERNPSSPGAGSLAHGATFVQIYCICSQVLASGAGNMAHGS
jgi:hypothetical protein